MTRAVIIGRSHTNAVAQALRDAQFDGHGIDVHLLESPKRAYRSPALSIGEAVEIAGELPPKTVLFLAMLGTYHNVIGLLRTLPSYDFLLNCADAPETGPIARIPHRAMAMAFQKHLERAASVKQLKAATKSPVFVLSTPPPKQDNEFLLDKFKRQKRQEYRGRSVADIGIERSATRLKLWKLESEITAKWARSEGIGYVEPPAQTLDASGFLRPEYHNDDATHANAAYGALVVEQILNIAGTGSVSIE